MAQTIGMTSREHLYIKVTPNLHLTYSKNGQNQGLVEAILIDISKTDNFTKLYEYGDITYRMVISCTCCQTSRGINFKPF